MNPLFEPAGPEWVQRVIDEYPLAHLVSHKLNASPLPLLAERDERGSLVSLFGHCARTNPLVGDFADNPEGLVIFSGPQGYISPSLVSKPDWGPTWNYASLRFRVDVRFVPEETQRSVEQLAEKLEGDRWTLARLGARADTLMSQIIAFRARVTGADHVFKLGQDESDQSHAEIVAGHPDRTLGAWMAATRRV
ncbi:FMN-binding negative transcriptional regulator [Sphingomonas psychrotolerans]|uniref:FMN-binding negative transcriptional regulator n=1 Tax=Sphingomonas psychrotolerans TaxID=1327635 RepID=A0ABU3NAV0_9SPHN|nr:FMN-binding negative transcriptional regulator [Sphingomonas psychrotolerans]MDT8760922.1 FMN-binding negative transcriptional regulator [Sphingomonas psychrotolerans]